MVKSVLAKDIRTANNGDKMKLIHSYSSISTWKKCPRLFKARYVDKTLPFQDSPAAARGREIHETLQLCLENRTTPPENLRVNPDLWETILRGKPEPEMKIAMTRDGEGCDFFGKDVWLRGMIDVYLSSGKSKAICLDWKTGRPGYTDVLQAEIYAAMLHAARGINDVAFFYLFVPSGKIDYAKVDGQEALFHVKHIISAVENDNSHIPKPSWLCRFCGLETCEYFKGSGGPK